MHWSWRAAIAAAAIPSLFFVVEILVRRQQFTRFSFVGPKARWMILLLCTVESVSTGCSKKQARPPEPAQKPPFAIRMPERWRQSEANGGMLLVATEPTSADAKPPLATMNVAVVRYSGTMTAEINWNLNKHSLNEAVGPFEEHESGEKTIDGRPWRWMVYSFASRTMPGVRMKCLVYASFKAGYLYAITGGTSVEKFDQYRPVFERAAQTFQFEVPVAQAK